VNSSKIQQRCLFRLTVVQNSTISVGFLTIIAIASPCFILVTIEKPCLLAISPSVSFAQAT